MTIRTIALTLTVALSALAPAAYAQEGAPPEPQPGPESEPAEPVGQTCVPECRTGYVCHQSQCISACNPACEANELCTAAGECVSKCNPACAAGEICTEAGQCAGAAPGAGIGVAGTGGPANPGWGRKAFVLSIITAIVVGGLTAGIVIADDETVGLALGIPATLIGAITLPIVASGGKSARRSGNVVGNPGLRLAGWILYGLALGDAVVLIGLGLGDSPAPAPVAGSVGLLGMASAIALGVDARNSAIEAELKAGMIQPAVGAARDASGDLTPTVGMQVRW